MERKPRKRQLDSAMIRTLCEQKGIYSLPSFETEFYRFLDQASHTTNTDDNLKNYANSPSNAWRNKPVGVKQAERLADFFGFYGNYEKLRVPPHSSWQQVLMQNNSNELLTPIFKSSDLGLFGEEPTKENDGNLPKVCISDLWKLRVSAKKNESVFLALRSKNAICQLAPNSSEQFLLKEVKTDTFEFPNDKWFNFPSAYGTGFREYIAIISKHLPIQTKGADDPPALLNIELNMFADALLHQDEPFKVARFPFLLVHESEYDSIPPSV